MTQIFIQTDCPFCQKVQRFTDKHQIDVDYLNIHEIKNEEKLVELGGKKQVPGLLQEDDTILYESDDIIDYLAKENNIETEADDYDTRTNFCPIG